MRRACTRFLRHRSERAPPASCQQARRSGARFFRSAGQPNKLRPLCARASLVAKRAHRAPAERTQPATNSRLSRAQYPGRAHESLQVYFELIVRACSSSGSGCSCSCTDSGVPIEACAAASGWRWCCQRGESHCCGCCHRAASRVVVIVVVVVVVGGGELLVRCPSFIVRAEAKRPSRSIRRP